MEVAAVRGPIVLLDDDPDTVHVTADALRAHGYAVEGYTDPRAALERLRRPPVPSLAIIDYWMPHMSGAEVVQALRAEGATVPVLVTTAARLRDIDHGTLGSAGVTVVLTKPFGLRRLVHVIEGTVGGSEDDQAGTA